MQNEMKELEDMKRTFGSEVREFEEGGYVFVYIPGLKMPPGCTPMQTDALLCPQSHSGYPSRLFFREAIQTSKAVNWNGQAFVLGHQWHAFSYNGVENMSQVNMVINHLRGMIA
jgi:hypothetical protein